MRLQKQKTREVNGKEYFRWTVVVPPDRVKELGWKEGEELVPSRTGEGLVIKKENSKVPSSASKRRSRRS